MKTVMIVNINKAVTDKVVGKISKYLVKKAKHGNKDAFTELININREALYNAAYVITQNEQDAMDAIGEAILSCWENISKLKNDKYFKTWLTRIVINKCYDILKGRQHYTFGEEIDKGYTQDNSTRLEVEEHLNKLEDKEKIILTLFYFDDYSVSDIAQILNISAGAVKTRLSRSRKHFKEIYLRYDSTDERGAIYEK